MLFLLLFIYLIEKVYKLVCLFSFFMAKLVGITLEDDVVSFLSKDTPCFKNMGLSTKSAMVRFIIRDFMAKQTQLPSS